MKKIYLLLVCALMSVISFAQSNQLVWANGRFVYASPIQSIDSLTYGDLPEIDTLFFLLPRAIVEVKYDTVFVHDTIYINTPGGDNPGGNGGSNPGENPGENNGVTEGVNYFYVASLEDGNQIDLTNPNTWAGVKCTQLEYSFDRNTWTRLKGSDILTLNTGDSLFMRCRNGDICKSVSDENKLFTTTGRYNVGGDIHTVMFDYKTKVDTLIKEYSMYNLFGSTKLVDASNMVLPAKVLSNHCYQSMFSGCTQLVKAPELPAMKLDTCCYYLMFNNTRITEAPLLLADSLVSHCYAYMFQNCIKLEYIKCLAKNIEDNKYTAQWTENVPSSGGKFVQSAEATGWVINYYKNQYYYYHGIPQGWIIEVEYDD